MLHARRPLALVLLGCAACSRAHPRDATAPEVFDRDAPAYLAPPPAAAACGVRGSATPPAAVAQIGATYSNTCARLVDGSVWCWGARGATLIDADVIGSLACPVATRVPELSPAAALHGTCITRNDGTIRCGDLGHWRFDDAESPPPGDGEQTAWFAGGECTLASGTVTCRFGDKQRILVTEIAALVEAEGALLAIRADGTLLRLSLCEGKFCEDVVAMMQSAPVAFDRVERHTCVLASDGRVWCEHRCAEMGCKELGFVEIPSIDDATQLAVGPDHACVVRRAGTVSCWGESSCGEAGGGPDGGNACARMRTPVEPTTISWAK